MQTSGASKVIIESVAVEEMREKVEMIMSELVSGSLNGRTVLVKPNMVGPSPPDFGHTTHPELVRAVVRSCLDRGAKVQVGDNPGGMKRSSRHVAEVTGILEASEGCFRSISDQVVKRTGTETGFTFIVSKVVLEADFVINMPKFKTHVMTLCSGALKNLFGYVAGTNKAKLHVVAREPADFARAICDIFQIRPPDLNIMDALTVIEGNGPCHTGKQREVGKLLASTDALALDCTKARMMGVNPASAPITREGINRKLGSWEDDKIEIRGELEPIPDFLLPATFQPKAPDRDEANKVVRQSIPEIMLTRTTVKPVWNQNDCILCEECVESCPAEALTIVPEFVMTDACISCYCCVELCPEGAMEVPDVDVFQVY